MEGIKLKLEKEIKDEVAKRAELDVRKSRDMSNSRRQIYDTQRQMGDDRKRAKEQAKGLQRQMQGQKGLIERKLSEERDKRTKLDQRQSQYDAERRKQMEDDRNEAASNAAYLNYKIYSESEKSNEQAIGLQRQIKDDRDRTTKQIYDERERATQQTRDLQRQMQGRKMRLKLNYLYKELK
jgi:hypothetical protein